MGCKQSEGAYALIHIFKITSTIIYSRRTCDYVKRSEFKAQTTVHYPLKCILCAVYIKRTGSTEGILNDIPASML